MGMNGSEIAGNEMNRNNKKHKNLKYMNRNRKWNDGRRKENELISNSCIECKTEKRSKRKGFN